MAAQDRRKCALFANPPQTRPVLRDQSQRKNWGATGQDGNATGRAARAGAFFSRPAQHTKPESIWTQARPRFERAGSPRSATTAVARASVRDTRTVP